MVPCYFPAEACVLPNRFPRVVKRTAVIFEAAFRKEADRRMCLRSLKRSFEMRRRAFNHLHGVISNGTGWPWAESGLTHTRTWQGSTV